MSAAIAAPGAGGRVAVALWDRDDRLVAVDDTFFDFFPDQRAQLQRGRLRREMSEAAAWLPVAGEEERVVETGGRTLHITEAPTPDGGRMSIVVDISAARAAAHRLELVDALLRDGLESMADGVTIWDADDRLVMWNAPYEAMHEGLRGRLRVGLPYEEAVRLLTPEVFRSWDPAQCARWTAERVALHRNCVSPREYVRGDGTTIEIRERRTSRGGIIAVFRDVTAQREATRALARSEMHASRLALVAAHARSAIAILDGARRIEWINPAFTALTGWSEIDAYGQDPIALVVADPRDPEANALRAALSAGRAAAAELLERRRDGSTYWSAVELLRAEATPGAPARLIMLRNDVTERRRDAEMLERALRVEREANAQYRRFVAIASHEFRTPLAVIDGATQRLRARLAGDDPEIDKRLDRIRRAVARIGELIDRTLSSARLDEGRIEIRTRGLNLATLLREVVDRQQQASPEFEIEIGIGIESDAKDLRVEGDGDLLEQVFDNLLSNAVKYSGRSRRIAIVVNATADDVTVAVRDHGVGIDAQEIPQLFTRFFRARSAMGIPGTGIGLHLVRELVRLHGGQVGVDSRIGEGTTFTVVLPRRQDPNLFDDTRAPS